MIDLKKFDDTFKEILDKIEEEVDSLNIDSPEWYKYKFKLSEYENSKITTLDINQGIYIFYIHRNSFDNFRKKWDTSKIKRYSPKIISGRIESYEKTKEKWIPIYIGKSKELLKRIPQHINLTEKQSTSSMKLKARGFKDETFAVKIIPLETNHYGFIAHSVESTLRKKVNPIVGKE